MFRIFCSDCDLCITVWGDARFADEEDLKLSCEKCEPKEESEVEEL